jgi:propionyl-CoA synthetase
MSRLDDIINSAGLRLSTAQIEEILLKHPQVVEAAVVGDTDELRGEIPISFVVFKNSCDRPEKEIQKELAMMIREQIGQVAYC